MIVVGAGGLATDLVQIFYDLNETESLYFFDNINKIDTLFNQYTVLKNENEIKEVFGDDNRFVLGIGKPALRQKLFLYFKSLGGELVSCISPKCDIGNFNVQIDKGACLMSGVKISSQTKIGKGALIYYNSVITHDVVVGDFVEISPNVSLLGKSSVGNMSSIGAGAIIFPNVSVGKNAVVAAGSVVRENVPDSVMVAGVPATIKKTF